MRRHDWTFRQQKIRADRIKNGNQGEIFIVNVDICEDSFVLINLYHAHTETKQIKHIKKRNILKNCNIFKPPIF